MEAFTTLVQDVFELVATDPLDIISDTISDTIQELSLGLVSILRRLIRIVMAVPIVAVLCCMDAVVGSLRISMCIMGFCFDMIEVLLGRLLDVSPRVCPVLHVAFLSLLILLVSS
jgi:hypothetical protein